MHNNKFKTNIISRKVYKTYPREMMSGEINILHQTGTRVFNARYFFITSSLLFFFLARNVDTNSGTISLLFHYCISSFSFWVEISTLVTAQCLYLFISSSRFFSSWQEISTLVTAQCLYLALGGCESLPCRRIVRAGDGE